MTGAPAGETAPRRNTKDLFTSAGVVSRIAIGNRERLLRGFHCRIATVRRVVDLEFHLAAGEFEVSCHYRAGPGNRIETVARL